MLSGGTYAGDAMMANRSGVRVDQIRFRLVVSGVCLAVAVWFLVCLAFLV